MDAENVAAQEVNIVDSCKEDEYALPIKPIDNGVAMPAVEENSKNGDFSSKRKSPISLSSLSWYVAKVKANHEAMAKKLMKNLDEPIEIWVPGLKDVDADNGAIANTDKYHIYGFVFFRFLPYDKDCDKRGQTIINVQNKKNTSSDMVKKGIFRKVISISYIRDILKIPGENTYAPIPAYQIERFRRIVENTNHPVVIVDEMLSKGQTVRFLDEKYKDIVGKVESTSDSEPYIYIVLDYLGCAKVKVKREMIEPIYVDDKKKKKEKKKTDTVVNDRTIQTNDWLTLHSTNDVMPVDKQYIQFANSILSYLENGTIGIPRDKRKSLALSVACYVEDKRSHLRLFASFVAAFRQKKEHFHPIELLINSTPNEDQKKSFMADYSPTKINAIDLAYLLMLHSDWADKDVDFIMSQGTRLGLSLRNLGCEKLQCNSVYADERRNLLLDGWQGLKHFLYWLVNGNHYLSRNEKQESIATILSDNFTMWGGVNPLYFTLTFARKSKVGDDIVSNIEKLKVLPPTRYDVLDDDYGDEFNKLTKKNRKKKRFLLKRTGTSHTSKQYPVLYDEISTRKYIVGETYICQLANYGKYWYLLTPPMQSIEANDPTSQVF